ncbi:MAG: hypothetical protein COA56_14130 [Dehalococcoidia bacterium]|nr:MAG: hypothetical protein COA56_14130 [Dehalococcoidia bacterium]
MHEVIKGILWHQGESDSGKEATAKIYEQQLHAMVTAWRKDLGNDNIPVVVGEMGRFFKRAKFKPVVDGALIDHAVQLTCIRVAAQPASRRVGSLVIEPGCLQARGIHVENVSGPVGNHHRMIGGHRVQVVAVKVAALVGSRPVGLGVVKLEALDPFSGRSLVGPFFQSGLYLLEAPHIAVGGHHVLHAAAQHVDMGVDEPRKHSLAAQVQHLGVRPDQAFDVLVATDPGEPAVGHGQSLRLGAAIIDRDDVGVLDDGFGLAVDGGHIGLPKIS